MVLRNRRQPLIKQILEALVVRLDEEGAPPQVRSPVPDRMDKADELTLVGGQCTVARSDILTSTIIKIYKVTD